MSRALPSFLEHYATGRFAPYLREHKLAGSVGAMLEAAQPAGDCSDPPVSDLVITWPVAGVVHQCSDLGGGRFTSRVPAGSLFLIAPETATDIFVFGPHVIRSLALSAAALRPHLEEARPGGGDPFDFGRLHAGDFRNPFVLGLLDRLWAESSRGDGASRLFADGAALAIVAELLHEAERPAAPCRGGLAPRQLRRATEFIEAHLARDVSLVELAAAAGLSPAHFSRAFRRATGAPPHRHLMRRRVERARERLAATDESVTEIAHACGFASSQHMATAFRRELGASPTEVRRAARL